MNYTIKPFWYTILIGTILSLITIAWGSYLSYIPSETDVSTLLTVDADLFFETMWKLTLFALLTEIVWNLRTLFENIAMESKLKELKDRIDVRILALKKESEKQEESSFTSEFLS